MAQAVMPQAPSPQADSQLQLSRQAPQYPSRATPRSTGTGSQSRTLSDEGQSALMLAEQRRRSSGSSGGGGGGGGSVEHSRQESPGPASGNGFQAGPGYRSRRRVSPLHDADTDFQVGFRVPSRRESPQSYAGAASSRTTDSVATGSDTGTCTDAFKLSRSRRVSPGCDTDFQGPVSLPVGSRSRRVSPLHDTEAAADTDFRVGFRSRRESSFHDAAPCPCRPCPGQSHVHVDTQAGTSALSRSRRECPDRTSDHHDDCQGPASLGSRTGTGSRRVSPLHDASCDLQVSLGSSSWSRRESSLHGTDFQGFRTVSKGPMVVARVQQGESEEPHHRDLTSRPDHPSHAGGDGTVPWDRDRSLRVPRVQPASGPARAGSGV
jgi:hypothetical protein